MAAVRTSCPYCGVGCGVAATAGPDRTVTIAGDAGHGANRGKLCSKGTHLGETVQLDGRLLHPMIGGLTAGWDEALDLVARTFARTIAEHGPDSVAFYGSGQLLTEDYYAFNKLMKGYIGAANIDTNSRLCMASAVAAHVRSFGEDVVPACYDDLDEADLIVLVGSNTAWCHPVIWQRIEAARLARGTKLVVIDPRRTETAEQADLHLPIRAAGDVPLFAGLLAHLHAEGLTDAAYLRDHVAVPDGFWDAADTADTAEATGLDPVALAAFYDLFAARPRTVTLFSMGVNQATDGTDKANAIINCHLATSRIGKPGAAPFSLTGQPNAMGGREVGGLANTLAAHMDFAPENVARVGRFWGSDRVAAKPGLKAVDLFRAVAEGKVKALWIAGTNPAVSMPDAGAVRAALAACPFVVVSEVIAGSDTAQFAHVRLPAAAWGEKDGTVTNSERRISRQRPFFPLPGEARQDWRIVADVATRMGHGAAFAWQSSADVFREHAALTAFENDGARRLNLARWATLSDAQYEALNDARWGGARLFEDGRFSTADGRARLVAMAPRAAAPASAALNLNTGRYRDQWHTMTRTGLSPRLSQHRREPLVEIHPDDAAAAGLANGDLARVATAEGAAIYRASISDGQRPGDLFVPMHWTDMTSSGGRTGLLTSPAVDPVSGQPGFKRNPAAIEKVSTEWRGFLLVRDDIAARPDCLWATRIPVAGGTLYELAGNGDSALLETCLPTGARVETNDAARGTRRIGVLTEGRLAAALFVTRSGRLPARDWLIAQLAEASADPTILAGRAAGAQVDRGAIVCVCFDVGVRTILNAIAAQALADVGAIGKALGAGTNCGSCRPALAKLIAEANPKDMLHAAE